MNRRPALAVISAVLAVAPVVAGCQEAGGGITRPPATFGPSPFGPSTCPPGWHREHDGDCLITGTLAPGQPLPLPSPGGTPLPVPPPLVRATSTGNGMTA